MNRAPNFIDRTGAVYGMLTLTAYAGADASGVSRWLCRCACGRERILPTRALTTGNTKSCGCAKNRLIAERFTTHGESKKTREYKAWANMHDRCRNRNKREFKDYGGRGITVCERWREYANFLADMGRVPAGLTLDRINNDGNYEPGNCRWATRKEQRANQRVHQRPATSNCGNKTNHPSRNQTHCKRGHPLSGDNLAIRASTATRPAGGRVCKKCDVIRATNYRERSAS